MTSKPRKLIIFFTVVLDLIGFGIVIPLLPPLAKGLDASSFLIGALIAVHSFVQFLLGPLFGALSDRIGRRPILLYTVLGNCLAYVLLAKADTLWMLFIARAISGASAANIATSSAYLSDITSKKDRAAAMGIIGAAFGIGFVLGPALAGAFSSPWETFAFTNHFQANTPYWIAAILSLFNFILIALRLPESLPVEKRNLKAKWILNPLKKIAQARTQTNSFLLLVIGYFLTITAFSIMTTLFSLFGEFRFQFGNRENSLMFTLFGCIGLVIQGGILRRIEPKTSVRKLILIGTAILSVALFALPLSNTVGLLVGIMAAVAIGNSFTQPLLNTAASRLANETTQGATLGIMASAGSLARVIGSLIAGPLMSINGEGAHFGTAALLLSGAIMALAFFLLRRLPAEVDANYSA